MMGSEDRIERDDDSHGGTIQTLSRTADIKAGTSPAPVEDWETVRPVYLTQGKWL